MDVLKSVRFMLNTAAFLSLFISHNVFSDIALLIHGFDSNASTWQKSGITHYLDQQGWPYKGILTANNNSVNLLPNSHVSEDHLNSEEKQKLYNANLLSTAPLEVQAQQLTTIIQWLNQTYPEEPIYLVGHSAGGLVARYTAVLMFQV